MTADQVLAALWRRRKVVLAVAAAVFAVGLALVFSTPKVFRATSVIRVDIQMPQEELVQRSVGNLVETQLITVRQELMGRPVLQRLIEELNLYPEIQSRQGMDAAVEAMRKDIDVKVEGDSAFEVTYSAYDPQTAAKVANRLPEIYAEEAVKVRKAQALRATSLFTDELAKLKDQLSSWEQQIAQFKVTHAGELPEQLETNMRTLDRLTGELKTKSEELRAAETRRSELVRSRAAADTEAGRLVAAESNLTQELVSARANWTSDHPEVKRLETELGSMKAKRQDAEGRMVVERQERARAVALVGVVEKDIAEIQRQIELYQTRLDNTPKWAHELGILERDHEIAKTKYQSLVSRKVEAELAQDLEAKEASRMFHVVSPAVVPSTPAKPDRMTGSLIALLVAMVLAVVCGVVLETRDDSIRSTSELKARLPVPVLAVVPQMNGRTERRVLMPAAVTGRNVVTPEIN
jgi:polysaccharide chain length determinant protein (PEP-CTERM system associated)